MGIKECSGLIPKSRKKFLLFRFLLLSKKFFKLQLYHVVQFMALGGTLQLLSAEILSPLHEIMMNILVFLNLPLLLFTQHFKTASSLVLSSHCFPTVFEPFWFLSLTDFTHLLILCRSRNQINFYTNLCV